MDARFAALFCALCSSLLPRVFPLGVLAVLCWLCACSALLTQAHLIPVPAQITHTATAAMHSHSDAAMQHDGTAAAAAAPSERAERAAVTLSDRAPWHAGDAAEAASAAAHATAASSTAAKPAAHTAAAPAATAGIHAELELAPAAGPSVSASTLASAAPDAPSSVAPPVPTGAGTALSTGAALPTAVTVSVGAALSTNLSSPPPATIPIRQRNWAVTEVHSISSSAAVKSSASTAVATAGTPPQPIPERAFTRYELQWMQQALVQGKSAEELAALFSRYEPISVQQVQRGLQHNLMQLQLIASSWFAAYAASASSPAPAAHQPALPAQPSAVVAQPFVALHTPTLSKAHPVAAPSLIPPQATVSAAAPRAPASVELLSPPTKMAHRVVPPNCPHCNASLSAWGMVHVAKCALRTPAQRAAVARQRPRQIAREKRKREQKAAATAAAAGTAAPYASTPMSDTVAASLSAPLQGTSIPLVPISSPIALESLPSLASPLAPADVPPPSASNASPMIDPLSADSRKRPPATAGSAGLQPAVSADALVFPPPGCVSYGSFPMDWFNSLDDSTPLNFLFSTHNAMHPSVRAALRKSQEDTPAQAKAQADFGCGCPNGVCWPATCPCSAAGRTAYSRHGKLMLQQGEHPEYVVECCATCSCNVPMQADAGNDGLRTASTALASPMRIASPSNLSRTETEQSAMSDTAVADSPAGSDPPAGILSIAPALAASESTLVLTTPLPASASVSIVGEDVFTMSDTGVPQRVLTPREGTPSPPPLSRVLHTDIAAAAMQGMGGIESSASALPLAGSSAPTAAASSPSVSVPRPLPSRCFNRVVQFGPVNSGLHLVVFKTVDKGWALKTLTRIPRHSFVCEYIGELIHEHISEFRGAQLAKRKRSNYLFTPALETRRKDHNRPADASFRSMGSGATKQPPAADDSYDIDRECFSIDSSQVRRVAQRRNTVIVRATHRQLTLGVFACFLVCVC